MKGIIYLFSWQFRVEYLVDCSVKYDGIRSVESPMIIVYICISRICFLRSSSGSHASSFKTFVTQPGSLDRQLVMKRAALL